MRSAQDLLNDYRTNKRHGCMSEYQSWIEDVLVYLEVQALEQRGRVSLDPAIQNQMELEIPEPQRGDIRYGFELLGEEDELAS